MLDGCSAIIFDMDGTLVDSGRLHEMAWIRTLEKYDIPIDRKLMRSLAGVPTKNTITQLIEFFGCRSEFNLVEMNQYKENVVRNSFKDYVRPTSLIDVVDSYWGRKPMSVGTGAYSDEAREILSVCGLLDKMDFVVGADEINNHKPAPDTFLRCAELMDVSPHECIVFEDSKIGLEAAERAGMIGIDVLQKYNIVNDYFL